MRFRRSHPGTPWLTPRAIEILDGVLLKTDRGLEFGSGGSTLWFANRLQRLVSVEHDQSWHDLVSRQLKEQAVHNVDYIFAPQDVSEELGNESEYARTALRFADGSLQFVLVDGVYRDHCTRLVLSKIAPGGALVIDNVNWCLPSDSRAPGSRRPADGPATETWREIAGIISGWRTIWTSCGVSDTAIFVRP
ncbi:O-methyltransferase [Micromonospora siamensis]|nr:class I SAM-dependent methyltransferase [Micromonospora siamensis]